MSYILDALKKAESERRLGSVPTVYAAAPDGPTAPDASRWRSWLPWLLAVLALTIVLLVAWLQPWRQQARATFIPAPTAIAAAPATLDQPAPAASPVAAETKLEPAVMAAPVMPPPPPRAAKQPMPAPAPPSVAENNLPAALPAAANPPGKEPAVAPTTPQPEENSVGTLRDLPQNIQSELPAIVVNGYIYAKTPADRSVLINQKLLHEGDQIAPDLALEKLLPKGAILNYKGYRYRVAF